MVGGLAGFAFFCIAGFLLLTINEDPDAKDMSPLVLGAIGWSFFVVFAFLLIAMTG